MFMDGGMQKRYPQLLGICSRLTLDTVKLKLEERITDRTRLAMGCDGPVSAMRAGVFDSRLRAGADAVASGYDAVIV